MKALFPQSYEESRATFHQSLALIQKLWPDARLANHRLDGDEDLTIDWMEAAAWARKERLLILTTGEHGIEGYVGAAMLQLFIQEYLSRLDPSSTGLLLVHAINPWGMKHGRRTNSANVDLNRNFGIGRSLNSDYEKADSLLNPKGPIKNLFLSDLAYAFKLLGGIASLGTQRFRAATLLGQYRFPQGLYYGGESVQAETETLTHLYRLHLGEYRHTVLLDMHTGYGPRYQMSLVNSCMEPRDSRKLERQFSYPLVVKSNPSEFYSIQGDMIDFIYTLVQQEFPDKRLYATSFEFGTLGDSFSANLRSLGSMILENQLHWFGATDSTARERILHDFWELFFPQEERWRTKATSDARQAFEGILRAEDLLAPAR